MTKIELGDIIPIMAMMSPSQIEDFRFKLKLKLLERRTKMTEFEQIKKYIEERLKAHKEQVDEFHDDVVLMGQIHEDRTILNEIEDIIANRDTMESDN